MKIVWFCFILALLVTVGPPVEASLASEPTSLSQYKLDAWQTEQGLPMNLVHALFQSHDGYLWIGTAGGLARFDGRRFTTFDVTEASLPVYGFMEDSEKTLWIGTSKGASIYHNGVFKQVFASEVTAGQRVYAFAQGADRSVWAASENGLIHWHNGVIKLYQTADGLPTNRLRSLTFDRSGTLWIATSGGGLVSFSDGQFEALNPSNGFPHLQVRSVLADPDGSIWAATAGAGLVHIHQGQITTYTVEDGLPTNQLVSLAFDSQGSLWIGTWGAGLSRMDQNGFTTIDRKGGLTGDQIWPLLVDRDDSIWIGTWVDGLNRLSKRTFEVFGTPEGLSSDNVRTVLHARDGSTWVATAGGGLNRIKQGVATTLTEKDGLPSNELSSLIEAHDGSLWVGSYTGGIARLKQGTIQTFNSAQGLPSPDIRVIYQDSKGIVWAGTQSGLAQFAGQNFEAIRAAGAPRDTIISILEDRNGTLWFGTAGQGLFSYRNGTFSKLTMADGLASNWILALYEDADRNLWIGTNGEGLNRLHDGKLTRIHPADGLWNGSAQVIIEDSAGYLWMTCNRGFYRVKRTELIDFTEQRIDKVRSTAFGRGHSLRSTLFAGGVQPAGAKDLAGRIWLPSNKGLAIVDPKQLPNSDKPPLAQIERVVINGKNYPANDSVTLQPGSPPLTIHYTAMTLLHPELVRFRYQLDASSSSWTDAGASREVSFPALPHGSYHFRVAASLDGQHWSDVDQGLIFTVQPHLYQTVWFKALIYLFVAIFLAAWVKLRTRGLRIRQKEMEQLVAQRTEELRLANEHLSELSFTDALTGLANRRSLNDRLAEEWRRAKRHQSCLALVMADIDAFKQYNDSFGHQQGDHCLTAIAEVFIRAAARAGDLAARYGGEELVFLMPVTSYESAMIVAEKLRAECEALAIPHPTSPICPVVTISLGVAACVPSNENPVDFLIAQADAALYQAKKSGRNRVC